MNLYATRASGDIFDVCLTLLCVDYYLEFGAKQFYADTVPSGLSSAENILVLLSASLHLQSGLKSPPASQLNELLPIGQHVVCFARTGQLCKCSINVIRKS
jgi:hypothetical protein